VNSHFNAAGITVPEQWYEDTWQRWRQQKYWSSDSRGTNAAREAVAAWYQREQCSIDREDVIITAGSSISYLLLFTALVRQGFRRILLPHPGYPLFAELATTAGLEIRWYTLPSDHHFDLPDYGIPEVNVPADQGIGALVLITPNNPSGADYSGQSIQSVAEQCAAAGITLIIDEVFSLYRDTDTPPNRPAGAFLLNGLSKLCAAPEVKAGWICVSRPGRRERELLQAVEVLHDTYLTLSGFGDTAITVFLEEIRDPVRRLFRERVTEMRRQAVQDLCMIPGVTVSQPAARGGIHLPISLNAEMCAERFGTVDDEQIAISLVQDWGLYLHPGYFYDIQETHQLDPWFVITVLHTADEWKRITRGLLQAVGGSS
jgi:aspartate/methionine/tyrosine aminotransferase